MANKKSRERHLESIQIRARANHFREALDLKENFKNISDRGLLAVVAVYGDMVNAEMKRLTSR